MTLTLPPTSQTQNVGYNYFKSRLILFGQRRVLFNIEVKAYFRQVIRESSFGKFGVVMISPETKETQDGRREIVIAPPEVVQENRELRDLVRPLITQRIEELSIAERPEEVEQVAGRPGEDFGCDIGDDIPF